MRHSILFIQKFFLIMVLSWSIWACQQGVKKTNISANATNALINPSLDYLEYQPKPTDQIINRSDYQDQLYGFWLAQCIANWTGLVTEMDKIGGEGTAGKGAGFYTRENWGQPDELNIWGFSDISDTITYVFEDEGGIWGADDDTDIEYIYQHLLYKNQTTQLTGEQIRTGWLLSLIHI